jgi:hypothetical protein
MGKRHWNRRAWLGGVAVVSLVAAIGPTAGIGTAGTGGPGAPGELVVSERASNAGVPSGVPADYRAQGVVWNGLVPDAPQCEHGYGVSGSDELCTHGPDPSDPAIDVTRHRSTDELVASLDEGTAATTNSGVPCYGDGTSGNRVQVVYAHAADVPDRYASLAASLGAWVANVDAIYNESAAETGGVRHVRWVTDPGCGLVVQRVQLSTTGDDSYGNTVSELKSVGLARTDRKYLVWVDANVYCGISSLRADDSPGATNTNNVGPSFGRVDSGCWGLKRSSEAHELMHLLGGVQYTAPNTSGHGHCVDEYDRMCYSDDTGVTMNYVCASTTHDRLFDCNHDDYYSTNPAAGSYLATHWNTASSSFLEAVEPYSWSPNSTTSSTSSSTTSSTTTTSQPVAPTTSTWSGTLSRKVQSATYTRSLGAGTVTAEVSFTKARSITLSVVNGSGIVVGRTSGPSVQRASVTVAAGSYTFTVDAGGSNAVYTLSVTAS